MVQLVWNEVGERTYESGVDRGVLYLESGYGVAWNGLRSVKESPSGGETTPRYIDGVKYLVTTTIREFAGSIEAYTYPDEFVEYEGWGDLGNGLSVDEQAPKSFCFSYRTMVGNDVDGTDLGYKIHLVYDALVKPSEREYASSSEETEPLSFSWDFTTKERRVRNSLAPLSHIVIDSRKTNATQLSFIEQYLYGTATQAPSLPSLEQMLSLFANPLVTLYMQKPDQTTGIGRLTESLTLEGDLRGRLNDGLYRATMKTRLTETSRPGLYILEEA